jgi:C1A family cysteine protease/uncharacterized tellurite resistance protein B-like protein
MANESYLIQSDGSKRRLSGYRFSASKLAGQTSAEIKYNTKQLPPKVDLRPYMTPVEMQGQTNSCVANAVAGAYEYLVKQHRGDDAYDVSRLFIYYNAREIDGEIADHGSYVADAIESLRQYGACSEQTWPFDEEMVNEEPSEDAYAEGEQFLVEDVKLVPLKLEAWKSCLAEGYPIIFGISLYNSFDRQKQKGVIPMPTPNEASREAHGGHSMLCVGYSDKDRVFIVRNSWGEDWGDEGYCYISYDYLMNPQLNDGDSWIIRRLENVDFDESNWGDNESVLEDYDTELANMSDEQYYQMLDAMGDYPLECRIGLIFLHAAGADGDITEEEIEEIAGYMNHTLELLGSDLDTELLLENCLNDLEDEELLNESIDLLNEFLSKNMLATIVNDLYDVAGIDELDENEENFVNDIMEAWQIEFEE